MGLDTRCSATFNRQTSVGRVQLETDYVLFRGDFRVKLALAAITGLATKDGVLSLKTAEGTLALALGPAADKWAAKIGSPKSRVEKLGVKPGARVSVVGFADPAFRRRADEGRRRRVVARAEAERPDLRRDRIVEGPGAFQGACFLRSTLTARSGPSVARAWPTRRRPRRWRRARPPDSWT